MLCKFELANQRTCNTMTLQSVNSKVCGRNCLLYAFLRSRQMSMSFNQGMSSFLTVNVGMTVHRKKTILVCLSKYHIYGNKVQMHNTKFS